MSNGAEGPAPAGPKAKIFISYSRKDMVFADRLDQALRARGFEPLIDREEIYAFEDWWARIQALIVNADTVIFILSAGSVGSPVCTREVAFAADLNKRFAPIVWQRVVNDLIPPALGRLNFIFFDDETKFDESMERLVDALSTNIGWVRQHTEMGEQARRWSLAGRPGPRGLLLRSPVLEEAEHWIATRPPGAPRPTDETLAFIAQSREATTRRQRIGIAGALGVAVLAAALSVWALIEQRRAVANEMRAVAGEQLAKKNEARAVSGEQLARANETRAVAGEQLAQAKEEEANRERQRAEMEEKRAKEARDRALETQSRLLAERSSRLTEQGNTLTAIQLALEAFRSPDYASLERYDPAAERSLADALYRHPLKSIVARGERKYVSAALSHDATMLAAVSEDGATTLWAMDGEGRVGARLELPADFVAMESVIANPAQPVLLFIGKDKRFFAWNFRSRERLPGVAGQCTEDSNDFKFDVSGSRLYLRCNSLRVFDLTKGLVVEKPGPILAFGLAGNGTRFATRSASNLIQVFDTATGAMIKAWKGDPGFDVAMTQDGSRVLTHNYQGVRFWNARTGVGKPVLRSSQSRTHDMVVSGTSAFFVTLGDDATRVWHVDRDTPVQEVNGGKTVFLPNGLLATAEEGDKKITLREMLQETHTGTHRGVEVATLFAEEGHVLVSNSGDGKIVLTLTNDGDLNVWVTHPPMLARTLEADEQRLGQPATISGDGKTIATGGKGGVTLWDAGTLAAVRQLPIRKKTSSDDQRTWRLLRLDREANRLLYDGKPEGYGVVQASGLRVILSEDTADLSALDLSPDGDLAIGAADKEMFVWSLGSAYETHRCEASAGILKLTFLDSASTAVIGTADGAISLVDTPTCASRRLLSVSSEDVNSLRLRFSHGLLLVATFRRLQIWSQSLDKVVFDASQSDWPVFDTDAGADGTIFELLPESKLVVGAQRDGFIRVFDIATRAEVLRFQADIHDCCYTTDIVAFPDGDRLLTQWSERGSLRMRIWRMLPTIELLRGAAKAQLPNCLSVERRRELGLQPEPPAWCIEMAKLPYDSEAWKTWLDYRRAGVTPPLPDTADWDVWVAARPK